MNFRLLFAILFTSFSGVYCYSQAEEDTLPLDSADVQEILNYYLGAYARDSALNYQNNMVIVKEGLATLDLDTSFKYLDPEETKKILVKAWGNPPQETLGMIFPDSVNPYLPEGWGVVIFYEDDG